MQQITSFHTGDEDGVRRREQDGIRRTRPALQGSHKPVVAASARWGQPGRRPVQAWPGPDRVDRPSQSVAKPFFAGILRRLSPIRALIRLAMKVSWDGHHQREHEANDRSLHAVGLLVASVDENSIIFGRRRKEQETRRSYAEAAHEPEISTGTADCEEGRVESAVKQQLSIRERERTESADEVKHSSQAGLWSVKAFQRCLSKVPRTFCRCSSLLPQSLIVHIVIAEALTKIKRGFCCTVAPLQVFAAVEPQQPSPGRRSHTTQQQQKQQNKKKGSRRQTVPYPQKTRARTKIKKKI